MVLTINGRLNWRFGPYRRAVWRKEKNMNATRSSSTAAPERCQSLGSSTL